MANHSISDPGRIRVGLKQDWAWGRFESKKRLDRRTACSISIPTSIQPALVRRLVRSTSRMKTPDSSHQFTGSMDDEDHQIPPPMSPLLDLQTAHSNHRNQIRDFDYGDREDVLAEAEELDRELDSFDPISPYPPPSKPHRNINRSNLEPRSTQTIINALSLGLRNHRSKLRFLLLLSILWPLVSWTLIYYLFSDQPALFPKSLKNSKSTLFVVAHPDDECLFFSPTILATIQRAKIHGALLVMSSGNHYGLGDVRKKELLGSCKQLGIREDRCDVMDISDIQDDPNKWWPVAKIAKVVSEHIERWMIDSVVTFDHYGVSGHINHRAVSASVTELVLGLNKKSSETRQDLAGSKKSPTLYVIKSVWVLRKYAGLYDLPISLINFLPSIIFGASQQDNSPLSSIDYDATTEESTKRSELARTSAMNRFERGLLINGLSGYRSARKAFWSHRTQMVWDRHLYMILSQFMYFNNIERIV